MAIAEYAPVDRGRLFGLKLKKNSEARQAAFKSIREVVRRGQVSGYSVRIGGAVRGRVVTARSRERAERLVEEHYNEEMLKFVERRR